MNPTDLALQTATKMTQKSNKVPQISPFQTRGVAVSTSPQSKLPIAPKTGGTQAISTALDTAKTINSNPITPTPEKIPETGAGINKISMQEFGNKIKEKYPQYIDVDSIELGRKMIEKYPEYQNSVDQQSSQNFITDLGSGIGQSVTGFGKMGKKLAIGAVNLYRKSQGQEKLTPEQIAQAEQSPMGQTLESITNRQTPEQKASIGGKIGMIAGSVAQGTAMGTPVTSAISKIPGVAGLATKAPALSKIIGGIGQGIEGQTQYSLASEGKLPTSKEVLTAGAFGGAINAIGPVVKGIKNMKAPKITAPFKGTRNAIAEGIVGSNLKNPAMREKYISKVGQTPEKTLLDEGITGSLGSQATQVANKSKQAYNVTREALKSIPTQVRSDEGLRITSKILDGVDTSIPGINDVIAPIKDMNTRFANGSATMTDLNDAKLLLARYESLYDDFGRIKKTGDEFEKKALAKMYNKMKTEIETIGDTYGLDIKSMNKETQKREGLRGLMDRAVAREAGRDMISLSDYMLGGITIADPMTAIPLTLGKKFFSSPKVSSRIAKFLYSKGDDVVTSSASNIGGNVANGATKQGLKYPIKFQQQGLQQGGATLPKPTPKTPPITVEKGAIGMGTPKVNNTPVIPPKATVAPSVSAPKKGMPKLGKETLEQNLYHGTNKQFDKFNYSSKDSTYGPGVYFTDSKDLASKYATKRTIEQGGKKSIMSRDVSKDSLFQGNDNLNYKKISDADYDKAVRGLADGPNATAFNKAKAEYAKQLMDDGYDGLQIPSREAKGANEYVVFDNRNIKKPLPPLPKKGMPKLGKEIMEQNMGSIDNNLIQEAKKYKSADEFINSNKEETIKMYRADSKKRDLGDLKERAFLTPNKSFAESYMENKVMGMHKGNKYLLEFDIPKSQVKEYVKGSEYLYNPEGAKEYKSQLKQIREQANKKTLPPLPKKGLPKLGKEVMEQNITKSDNLINEAKKYKSADEFVNDNKKLFHTTSELNAQKINSEGFVEGKSKGIGDRLVDGVFFVDNELPLPTITKYSKEPSNIVKGFVSKNSKIKEFKTMDDFENFLLKDEKYISLDDPDLSSKRAKEIFIQNGIDVIIKPYGKGTEYIVVNPKVLKTESQLKQIREQANKKPLPPLPKKGK